MRYQNLKHTEIALSPKEEREIDADDGIILIPQTNSKIYLHWLTSSGKLAATYTMVSPIQVTGLLKLINGQDDPAVIQIIELPR